MFQCYECGQGVYVKDCTFHVEYNPEHNSPSFNAMTLGSLLWP
jgi:hypothetical protein